ncbi:BRCT domain-containing protein [Klebsiella spallanzanii]|uniref:DNA ligase n=1 Tax=Klebsiella spallanzanii TaxID=2587528 RepID=A0A564MB82_9ENTR|nr:BRCT domain-containing protein [Klebsiella spallanzanii]VUS91223.1 DNA ligase [Klebsiella spallanzanii]
MTEHSKFSYLKNRDKLFANLISIIDGILSDGALDQKEILYLDTWLLESQEISDNYCVKAIRHRISDVLADGVIDETEIKFLKADLIKIQKELIDLPYLKLDSIESDRHLLEGLCKGVLANTQLNDSEIKYLRWFLSVNGALKNNYPGKELYVLVEEILQDGVITEDEREQLRQALVSFTGCDLESGIVDGLSTQLPIDTIETLDLVGATVCLTGEFLHGKRSTCAEEIRQLGANVVDSITQKLDYLIIGTMSSKDWRYKSHGRKIEKAVAYRDEKGIPLKIISEEQWKRFYK